LKAIAAFLNLFSLRVSRFGILSGCLEATSPSRVMFIPHSKPRRTGAFFYSLRICGNVTVPVVMAGRPAGHGKSRPVGEPTRRVGACHNAGGWARHDQLTSARACRRFVPKMDRE